MTNSTDSMQARKASSSFTQVSDNTFQERLRNLTAGEKLALSEALSTDNREPDDPFDIQVGGSHYRECEIQPGQYILANGIGFFEGCMIKRLTRYNRATGKGLEDLRKVRHEIDILIAEVERNGIRKPQQRE